MIERSDAVAVLPVALLGSVAVHSSLRVVGADELPGDARAQSAQRAPQGEHGRHVGTGFSSGFVSVTAAESRLQVGGHTARETRHGRGGGAAPAAYWFKYLCSCTYWPPGLRDKNQ